MQKITNSVINIWNVQVEYLSLRNCTWAAGIFFWLVLFNIGRVFYCWTVHVVLKLINNYHCPNPQGFSLTENLCIATFQKSDIHYFVSYVLLITSSNWLSSSFPVASYILFRTFRIIISVNIFKFRRTFSIQAPVH